MDHLAEPLERLQAEASRFVADRQQRILYVAVDEDLAAAAHGLIQTLEWHAENRGPFFELLTPFTNKAHGWTERTQALRDVYEAHAAAYDRNAIGLPSLPAADPKLSPQHAFAATVAFAARAFSSEYVGTDGVTVVLLPGETRDGP